MIEPMTPRLIESDVRKLRDQLYGRCSDHNWNACKHNWLREDSIRWLIESAAADIRRWYDRA